METHTNSYKLEQGNKLFIFSISIIGNSLRMSCQNTSSIDNKKYYRDFTIEQLRQIDSIFNFLTNSYQASEYIDKALRKQKVGIIEKNGKVIITFYITSNGITHQIEIPLGDPTSSTFNNSAFETSGNQFLQTGNVANFDPLSAIQTSNTQQNDIEAILKASFGEPSPEEKELNKYFENIDNTNLQETNINQFNTNGFLETRNINSNANIQNIQNVETPPIIGPVNNSLNQYIQSINILQRSPIINTQQYGHQFDSVQNIGQVNNNKNQFLNSIQNISSPYRGSGENNKPIISPSSPIINSNNQYIYNQNQKIILSPNSPSQKIEENKNINEQIKKLLKEQNINSDEIQTETLAEVKKINSPIKPSITTTKVLPVQTTTKILPPIVSFNNNINGINFQEIGNIISQKSINSPYQDIQTFQSTPTNEEILQSFIYQTPNNVIKTQHKQISTNINKNLNNTTSVNNNTANNVIFRKSNEELNNLKRENIIIKKQLSELRKSQKDLEEVKILRDKLAELEPLKKKKAEMEVLRGQLTELNTLRAQVAEYNAVKGQLKEINNLRKQLEQFNSLKKQFSELNALKIKAAEVDNLKLRIEELEKINQKYENEIKNFKDMHVKYLSIKSKQSKVENKEEIYEEENSQNDTVKGDIIHNTDELELLTRKINKDHKKLTLNLLYKATADSDRASVFHAKCDDANSTIVLVETDKGKRFGGFTTCSWSGDCLDKKDEDAFVFSLDKMKTYDNIPGDEAIGCYPKFGPIFLGCQIRIYDNAFTKGGTTFEKGLNYETEEDFELTGGDRVFNVSEIEVYEVIKE